MNDEVNEIKIKWLKEDLKNINEQVFTHIPGKIVKIGEEVAKLRTECNDFQISNQKWLISILVSVIFLILGLLLTYFK